MPAHALRQEKSGWAHLLESPLKKKKSSDDIRFISGESCSLKNIFHILKANVS